MESCHLCPRQCHAPRQALTGGGFCGMGDTPCLGRIAPHLWEEPPISGTRGTGALFFSGCTLRCAYCQNGDISHRRLGRPYSPAQLAEAMARLCELGVHTISFVTGTQFVPAILEALRLYRPPVPLVWNTGGYETVETLRALEGVIDVYLPDLKHYAPRFGALCAAAPDYFAFASQAIVEMCRQTGLPRYDAQGIMTRGTLIRHLILPGLTGESIRLLDWVHRSLPQGAPVSLMRQYVPCNDVAIPGLDRRITPREYQRVLEHMLALDIPGYFQDAPAASHAFVPSFNGEDSYI